MVTERRIENVHSGERKALSPGEVARILFDNGRLDVGDRSGNVIRIECGREDGRPAYFIQQHRVTRLEDGSEHVVRGQRITAPSPSSAFACVLPDLRARIHDQIMSQQ